MARLSRRRYRQICATVCVLVLILFADAYVTNSISAYYFPQTDHRASYIWMAAVLLVAAMAALETGFAILWRHLDTR
jgi:hypothetical protein